MFEKTADEVETKIDSLLDLSYSLLKKKIINQDMYNKILVNLSFEYASIAAFEDAFDLLCTIDLNYFGKIQLEQMEEDPSYKAVVIEYAEILNKVFDLNNIYLPNVPRAKA